MQEGSGKIAEEQGARNKEQGTRNEQQHCHSVSSVTHQADRRRPLKDAEDESGGRGGLARAAESEDHVARDPAEKG